MTRLWEKVLCFRKICRSILRWNVKDVFEMTKENKGRKEGWERGIKKVGCDNRHHLRPACDKNQNIKIVKSGEWVLRSWGPLPYFCDGHIYITIFFYVCWGLNPGPLLCWASALSLPWFLKTATIEACCQRFQMMGASPLDRTVVTAVLVWLLSDMQREDTQWGDTKWGWAAVSSLDTNEASHLQTLLCFHWTGCFKLFPLPYRPTGPKLT